MSRRETFLWNRNSDLGWFWAEKKKWRADYEQLLRMVFSCIQGQKNIVKSVHFKKPVMRSSFLSKSVVIFVVVILKMTTLFERNEDRITGFLK